ncbi:hypothetical protein KO510_00235 [Shimia thalassica]|nr:hypothetical protein [Shimia thalassica]
MNKPNAMTASKTALDELSGGPVDFMSAAFPETKGARHRVCLHWQRLPDALLSSHTGDSAMCMGPNNVRKESPSSALVRVSEAGFDHKDLAVLKITRLFFQSFVAPETQAWMRCFAVSGSVFGQEKAARVVEAVLCAVQSMRTIRRSGFQFSNPDCPNCDRFLSENERQLMGVFVSARSGRPSAMHANAMVLCEGNNARTFLNAAQALANLLCETEDTSMLVVH